MEGRTVEIISPGSDYYGKRGKFVRFESGCTVIKFPDIGNVYFEQEEVKILDGIESDSPTKPSHYGKLDVFTYAKEHFTVEEVNAYHQITAIKYITRAGKKDGNPYEQDIKKAITHLQECLKGEEG